MLLRGIRGAFPRLAFGWADQGYRGPFLDWARQVAGVELQVVVRRDGGMRRSWAPAGAPPRVVPRFAGGAPPVGGRADLRLAGRFRWLAKDYEYLPVTSENAIYLAMSIILLRRMTRPASGPDGSSRSRAGAAAHSAGRG